MKKTFLYLICAISLSAFSQEKLTPPVIGDAENPITVQSDVDSSKRLEQEIGASDTELFDAMKQAKLAKLHELAAKSRAETAKANAEAKKANNGELVSPMGAPTSLQMMQSQQLAQISAQQQKVKVEDETKPKKIQKTDSSPLLTVLIVSGDSARIRVSSSNCDVVVGSTCGGLSILEIIGNSVKAKTASGKIIVESIAEPYQYPVNEIKPVVKPDQKQPQGMKK